MVAIPTDCISSESNSAKSGLADSDIDSLDSEDMNLDLMSTSQFLPIHKEEMLQLDPILSDEDDTNNPKPTHLSASTMLPFEPGILERSVPSITVITPETDIFYARETYFAPAMLHLLPSHIKEEEVLSVLEGDMLVVMKEWTDSLWIVKACRTNSVGILPSYIVEGELERVARLNMEVNGRMSSPDPEFASSSSSSEGGSGTNSTPTTPDDTSPLLGDSIYVADQSFCRATKVRRVNGAKSVGFVSTRPRKMFRYPPVTYAHEESEDPSTDWMTASDAWPDGWEEEESTLEDSVTGCEAGAGTKRMTKRGRKRNRKW